MGLGCATAPAEALRAPPERCPPPLPSATRPFPLLWEAGRGYRVSLCFRRERAECGAGEARDGRALGSASVRRSAVTPARVPRGRPAASDPGYPLLAGQADSVRKRAMSPIVLPRNERAAAGRGGSVRPGARGSRGLRGRPGPLGPTGSGRKWGHRGWLGRGPKLGGPRAPPRAARLACPGCRSAGGRGPPAPRWQPGPGRADAGVGRYCRCKGAAAEPGPAATSSRAARSVPSPLRGNSPLSPALAQPRARRRGRRGRRGSAGPHVRALPGGGVPGRARAAARGGRGVPRTPSLLLLLPPRPPLPLPSSCAVPSSARAGGSARRARPGQALREAGAPGGGGGRDGGGGGSAGRETLPLCALRPGGGGQATLLSSPSSCPPPEDKY